MKTMSTVMGRAKMTMVAMAAALILALLLAADSQARPPTCFGKAPTIVGTNKAETLSGTSRPDVIVGLGGNDTILGKAGDDRICGGDGKDGISGREGDDRLAGDANNDQLHGLEGQDLLLGGSGEDELYGGDHPDALHGQGDADLLKGEGGKDFVAGGTGDDADWANGHRNAGLYGGAGPDRIVGSPGNDALFGESGDDNLSGQEGRDYAHGGEGDDTVRGGEHDDSGATAAVLGGTGNDRLFGESGKDYCSGGADNDLCDGGTPGDPLKNTPDDPDTCEAEQKRSCFEDLPDRYRGPIAGSFSDPSYGNSYTEEWSGTVLFERDETPEESYYEEYDPVGGTLSYTVSLTDKNGCSGTSQGIFQVTRDSGGSITFTPNEPRQYKILAGWGSTNPYPQGEINMTCPDPNDNYQKWWSAQATWLSSGGFIAVADLRALTGTFSATSSYGHEYYYEWNLMAE